MNDRKSVQTLLLEALEIENMHDRAAYLAEACGEDQNLRREIDELIAAQAAAGAFLEAPNDSGIGPVISAFAGSLEPNRTDGVVVMTEKPGEWVGRYKLLEKIGEGGCGAVYMAEQETPLRRRVALKVIKHGMDTEQVMARFDSERQTLALMDHPNIAKVLDAGATEAGRPFFVMELVRGIKITDYCHQNELSTRDRLDLFIKVCQAVQHAHQKGVIHRDLKPSNILVTVNDGAPVPKVIDFGIAKATAGRLTDQTLFTAFDQFLGTPAYMSPEQAVMTSHDIDTRSDIYGLGVLLYELLTGKTPFDTKALLASGLDELRRTICEREPVRPSTRLTMDLADKDTRKLGSRSNSDKSGPHRTSATMELIQLLRGDLDWIVMKCLEKDRARRYETANGLASDLKRHLNGEPVMARPPSRMYRLQKAAQRNKLAFGAGLAVVAALLAGAVLSTWQAVRAERERRLVQRNVVRQYVANGTRLVNAGDLFGALLWFAEALRLDPGDARAEEPHRLRIASVLRQCPKLLNVLSHGKMLYHAAFSPDGSKVVTASDDHTARVWDATSGKELLSLPHEGAVKDATFSANGRWIVTSSHDRTARVWDAQTGALRFSLRHENTVWRSCFSQDNRLVATACGDGTARIWDATTGQPLGSPLKHDSSVEHVSFSPDAHLLGTTTLALKAYVWELTSGQQRLKCDQNRGFSEVVFSSDGQRFLTCDGPNLHVHDAKTMEEASFSPLKQQGEINEIGFSPDGRAIVAGDDDFTAHVWDTATGRALFPHPIRQTGRILASRFSPDGRRLVTAGEDTVAQLWSTVTGQPVAPPLKHILHVKYVQFNADGRRLLGNSCDQAARVWDLATSDLTPPLRPTIPNERRAVSADGRYVLAHDESNTVWIVDTSSGGRLAGLPHAHWVTYAAFSRDDRTVITACEEYDAVSSMRNDIFLWDVHSGRRLNEASMAQDFWLLYAAFSPDSQYVLTCGFDFNARVWDARTGEPRTPLMRHGQRISWGAFSPDGRSVVTASWDKTARVWDASTGNPLTPPLQHKAAVAGALWSADGKRLYTLTAEDYLQVWDLASGELLTVPRKTRETEDRVLPFSTPDSVTEDLPRENGPVADLVRLAQMLAVGRIDQGGNVVPLQLSELRKAWDYLHENYRARFAATPSEILAWHRQEAAESEAEGNWAAALFHLDRARIILPQDRTLARERSEVEAAVAKGTTNLPQRWPSPTRDPRATAEQIDLSIHYNKPLHERGGAGFADLLEGLQTLGGQQFDVRGRVVLNGKSAQQEGLRYPNCLKGILVGRKCRRLHFLQGSEWGAADGEPVGRYVLHYLDGRQLELPIAFGRDTSDCWSDALPQPPLANAAIPVWTCGNRRRDGGMICLYKSTRDNPRPDVELASIDFLSDMSSASPFLVALTVE